MRNASENCHSVLIISDVTLYSAIVYSFLLGGFKSLACRFLGSWAAWDAGPLSQQCSSAVGVPGKYLGSPQVTEIERTVLQRGCSEGLSP